MNYEAFSDLYDEQKDLLDSVCLTLEENLKMVLKELLRKEFFRIRITEARVKDKESLFAKITNKKISPQQALTIPGKARDLIGARVVCHNLSDIDRIIETIEDAGDTFMLKRPKRGKEKNYIKEPQPPFGYRAHHIDVLFKHGDITYQAEVQVRTLLQDTWATFMHQDVYKGPINQIVKQHLSGLPWSISDLFHALDNMSQSLREYVERNPISPDVKIKAIDALQYKMNSFVEFYTVSEELPIYKSVERTDRYYIDGRQVRYKHSINAETVNPVPFEFLLGGDSGSDKLVNLSLVKLGSNSPQKVPFCMESLSETVVKLWRKPKRSSKYHHYQIECEWPNIFEQEIDYIFSPWARYYKGAHIDYVLELQCGSQLVSPPKFYLLDLSQPLKLHSLFSEFGTDSDIGEEMEYNNQSNIYRKKFFNLKDTVLCLMHFKRNIAS